MANFIKPCEGRVTSPFGNRIHPISHTKKMHWGVDYGNNPSNNSIIASAAGTVSYASVMGGYGNVVMVQHKIGGKTYETVYAHLAHISVNKGQTVKQGQLIGVKGTSGNSTGIHLHFEIHVGGRRNSLYTFAKNPLFYVSDPEVEAVQNLLNRAGYNVTVDGIEGEKTTAAVKKFQKANALVSDGIAGTKTIAALKAVKVVEKVSKPVSKVLKSGGKGAEVKAMQQALASVYFYPDKGAKNNGIDGVYGAKTKDAVRRFQSAKGLTADGIFGAKTKDALNKSK